MDMERSQNYALIDTDCIPQRDTEPDFPEWFEDAASEVDWIENINLHEVDSSTIYSLAGSDPESDVRSMTLLDELYEKNKILERQWREAEQKHQNLQVEHQKLTIQLSNERHRANKYLKKLQYIQDNHEVFNRLKQAYLNMKYNESAGRTMVEINERGSQTWEGILCDACIQTAELKRQEALANACKLNEPQTIIIKKTDLSVLQQTVQALKNKIEEREQSWSYNAGRENTYKATIAEMQNNIQVLKDIIAATNKLEIPPVKPTDSTPEMMHKENGFLKKIIVKLEKRHRDMERMWKPADTTLPLLNDQEKTIVHQLIKKYANKLRQKAKRSLSCGMTPNPPASTSTRLLRTSTSLISRPQTSGQASCIEASGEGSVVDVPSRSPSNQNEISIPKGDQ